MVDVGDTLVGLGADAGLAQSVSRFIDAAAEALEGGLAGAYLYGSLARGCFHPATSDVDLLLVTEAECSDEGIARIEAAHRSSAGEPWSPAVARAGSPDSGPAGVPLDVVAVTRDQLLADVAPAPVAFVLKPAGAAAGRARRLPESKREFPIDRQDARDAGVTLVGPPADTIIPAVPWPILESALRWLFPHIVPHFKNPGLMLCRVTRALATGSLSSKRDAGIWAVDALDPVWRSLIQREMAAYAGGVRQRAVPTEELQAFERYCAGVVGAPA